MEHLLSNICDKLIKENQQSDIWIQQICAVKSQNSISLCHLFPTSIGESELTPTAFLQKTKYLIITTYYIIYRLQQYLKKINSNVLFNFFLVIRILLFQLAP